MALTVLWGWYGWLGIEKNDVSWSPTSMKAWHLGKVKYMFLLAALVEYPVNLSTSQHREHSQCRGS